MQQQKIKVFVGYDPRFPLSYGVTVRSIRKHSPDVEIIPLLLAHLQAEGIYTRPTHRCPTSGDLRDVISNAPMSTEFAISRFLVPYLAGFEGHAIFVDGDFLFRDDIAKLVTHYSHRHLAVCVVKHDYRDTAALKMGMQQQTSYPRKNWSSLMLFNCAHPALQQLQPAMVNSLPGRELHALRYIRDEDIGGLPEAWNWLEGHSDRLINPKAVHFTRGTPEMGMVPEAYGDEWETLRKELA